MRKFVTALVFICLLFGCSPADKPAGNNSPASSAPVSGDWAVVRYEAEPDTLNWLTHTGSTANYAMVGVNNSFIYELLMAYNTRDWAVTEPLLVESAPDVSPDHRTYTFRLRDGIKWHDGQPLTAEDVLFTFKAAMCPLVDAAPYRAQLTDLQDIQIDGRTIRFTMAKANVFNLNGLANTLAIMPRHVFDVEGMLDGFSLADIMGPKGKLDPKIVKFADQFNNHSKNRAPVGTGPYKFEKWETGRELTLSRNDNYWGKKPYLDKIVIRIIPDSVAALTALKAGDIDLDPRLTGIQYAQQTSGPEFDSQFAKAKYSIPGYTFIAWNEDRPFFKDKRVRQALTMLIDRQQIIDKVRFGFGRIGVGPMNPNGRSFNPNLKPLPYDPARAAQLLDEAGWKDHDGDGIRDKDGVKFKFEFLSYPGSTLLPQLVPLVKESLRKAGIDMTERTVDFNVLQSSVKEHRFDAFSQGWAADLALDDPYQIWHSSAANKGSNYIDFKNPESDRLIEAARLEFNDEKRKEIYWKWQELIQDEQPYTFLYYNEDSAAYSKRFQNVSWLPVRPGYDLNSWFVPKGSQKYPNGK